MATLAIALKVLHLLCMAVFFGTGLGTAWVKLAADRSGALAAQLWAQRFVAHADLVFTIPAGVLLPASGLALATVYGLPWTTPWLLAGISGWAIAGLFWLPAWRLQYRMLALVEEAAASGRPLSPAYRRYSVAWGLLGLPSFGAAVFTIWVMVAKSLPW